jgi:2-haloalkanoic acid dehalogenase type II
MFHGLQPLLTRLLLPNPYINDRRYTLTHFQRFEAQLQTSKPTLPYNQLLSLAYTAFAADLGLPPPSKEEANYFSTLIGSWPSFPDTVPALQSLKKRYKLVLLSNIDNSSIAATVSGPLKGVEFDAVYTAENIGSYKPDLKNFEYLLKHIVESFGVEKDQVLHVAQSLTHDLVPAREMGMRSVWIEREEEGEKLKELRDKLDITWRFGSLGEMAEGVEREFEGKH